MEKTQEKPNNQLLITVVVGLIVMAASFFGGMKYQQSKAPVGMRNFAFQNGMMGGSGSGNRLQGGTGNRMGFRPVNGEIISADDKSITVKLIDGSSRIVIISDKTTVNKAATASKTDLTKGTKVAVFGQENNDGSVTAQSVQIDPAERMMLQNSGSSQGTK